MKIILLKDVKGVGKRFEEKNVSDGYANNFLLPKGLGLIASDGNRKKAEELAKQSESKREVENKELEAKELKRKEKHEELEKFRQSQRESPSS